jgi:hypothetical protein
VRTFIIPSLGPVLESETTTEGSRTENSNHAETILRGFPNIYNRTMDRCTVELLDQGLCLVDCSAVREVIPTLEGLRGTSCMAAAGSPSPEVVKALTA